MQVFISRHGVAAVLRNDGGCEIKKLLITSLFLEARGGRPKMFLPKVAIAALVNSSRSQLLHHLPHPVVNRLVVFRPLRPLRFRQRRPNHNRRMVAKVANLVGPCRQGRLQERLPPRIGGLHGEVGTGLIEGHLDHDHQAEFVTQVVEARFFDDRVIDNVIGVGGAEQTQVGLVAAPRVLRNVVTSHRVPYALQE